MQNIKLLEAGKSTETMEKLITKALVENCRKNVLTRLSERHIKELTNITNEEMMRKL